ncbi:MAG: GmrSD restriction endonuclease domain-containing protein [Ardenticatenaceae bacterium]
MAEKTIVYLDHLIRRESLRYKRSEEQMDHNISHEPQILRMSDLYYAESSKSPQVKYLRKPDFQRATWAWTPEDCVSLLDSIVNDQVIPSIIMWSSKDSGFDYVLDGGHRISVVMAWLNDDWGDKNIPDSMEEEEKKLISKAADEVRELIRDRVGKFSDYQAAEEKWDCIIESGGSPKRKLSANTFQQARFYKNLLKGSVGFHILWVKGDYEKAEQSFLKINKSGRQLSDWETKLVENRHSSFLRAVMSIANINSVQHYWPSAVPLAADKAQHAQLEQRIEDIVTGVKSLNDILFNPPYQTPIISLRQPLLVAPSTQKKPVYLAELLTVIEGGRGQEAETKKLIEKDKNAAPEVIINHGWDLITGAKQSFDHLIGNSPKSLALVPLLYFYSDQGRYVRSLLYGLIHWLLSGSREDILKKKRVFCAYRKDFEDILKENKEDIIFRFSRKKGSGPEVTVPTAQYYEGLLELLIRKKNKKLSEKDFEKEYDDFVKKMALRQRPRQRRTAVGGRQFTPKQKSATVIRELLDNPIRCGICGGVLDPSGGVQHDHILEASKGGATDIHNQRLTHPFCNNQRKLIEEIRGEKLSIQLPRITQNTQPAATQLSFFDTSNFS